MKKTILQSVLLASGVALLAGCASTQSTYVPQGSNKLIVNTGKVNIQDFEQAGDTMVQSLIDNFVNPGLLKSSVAAEPALLAISRIKNDTGSQLDTDLLVKKIRVSLNRTGKVQTSLTMGINGAEDKVASDMQAEQEFFADQKHTRSPDYTLSGAIKEVTAKAGNVRQSSFVFQLSLGSKSGVAVWEEETTINKQGSRSSVGF